MLVFANENLALLAVPKTGSTALEGALAPRASLVLRDPPQLKHAPLYRFDRFLRPMFAAVGKDAIETMALVRHPEDWLGSWYRYRARDALTGHQNSTRDISFDDFVQDYCRDSPAPRANVGSQAKFVGHLDQGNRVDHLFRYEAWDSAIQFLEARLGTQITPKRMNASPQMLLTLSPTTRALLHQTRAAEFDVWEAART